MIMQIWLFTLTVNNPYCLKNAGAEKERDRCGELKRIVSTTAKGETRQGEQGKVMRRKERKDEIL